MVDVDMADAGEEPQPQVHLDVLQFIKAAQTQHGLRHNDYARYRQHCTKKGQRLRKSLKLTHGRGKFVRKQLEISQVTSPGHLQLPLVAAERAWAWAQEARGRLEGEKAGPARQDMLRRLAKASKNAAELARFATARGTARTAVEAEAYAAHLSGLHLLEHPSRQAPALAKLLLAQRLCEALAAAGSHEARLVARQRADDIEPVVRFARYQLGSAGQAAAGEAPAPETQARLDTLAAEAEEGPPPDTPAAAVQLPGQLTWRGKTHEVFGERLKAAISKAAALEPQLQAAESAGDAEAQAVILEGMIAAFGEAKGIVRHSLAAGAGSSEAPADTAELQALETAVTGRQLELVLRRGQLLAAAAEARLAAGEQANLNPRAKQPRKKGKKGARGQGPAALVRAYDNLAASVRELQDAAARLGGAAGEHLLDECAAKAAELKARRCHWLARSFLADGKAAEAAALFERAAQRAAEAGERHAECARPDAAALQALEALAAEAGGWRVLALARAAAIEESAAEGVSRLALSDSERRLPVELLTDDLTAWRSFAGGEGDPPRLAALPPRPAAIPMRPFLLDCALSYITPPDLSGRFPKEEKKSGLGRLFGWGAAK